MLIPLAEYNEAKKRYDKLKETQSSMQKDLKILQQRNAPYINLLKYASCSLVYANATD